MTKEIYMPWSYRDDLLWYFFGYISFFALLLSAFSDYFYRCQNHRSRISMTPFKCHLAIYFIFLSIPPRPATAARSHDSINQEMIHSYTYQTHTLFFCAGWHRSQKYYFLANDKCFRFRWHQIDQIRLKRRTVTMQRMILNYRRPVVTITTGGL